MTPYDPIKEFKLWVKVNHLEWRKFSIIRGLDELTYDDVFFSFFYQNFTNPSGRFEVPRDRLLERIRNSKAYSVVHLSHYGYNTEIGASNAKIAEIDLFVSENNLAHNSEFFKKYFPWYEKDVYVLPFVPKERFISRTPFGERKNKAIATGTITLPIKDDSFMSFFKNDMLQPMRHALFNQASNLTQYLDSIINHITDGEKEPESGINVNEEAEEKKNNLKFRLKKSKAAVTLKRAIFAPIKRIERTFRKVKSAIMLRRAVQNGLYAKAQNDRPYYKKDIVSLYNEYRMFIVPEEVIGLPGIGFVEGMACGSAYIGVRDPMYLDLGLEEGVHYIAYDGTIADLVEKIAYFQAHSAELEGIAESGSRFIRKNLNRDTVMNAFISYLKKRVEERRRA